MQLPGFHLLLLFTLNSIPDSIKSWYSNSLFERRLWFCPNGCGPTSLCLFIFYYHISETMHSCVWMHFMQNMLFKGSDKQADMLVCFLLMIPPFSLHVNICHPLTHPGEISAGVHVCAWVCVCVCV